MRQGKPSCLRAVAAIGAAACLLGASLVAAQVGTITVTSPASGDEIHSGVAFLVIFEVSEGVTEPYDVELFEHDGAKYEIDAFCSWENSCDTEGGSVSVTIPDDVEIGQDYAIVVTERSSSLFGTSESFELLEAPAVSSSSVVQFRHVGGGGGAVGDMNTAMIVMASVCGVILLGALCAASWFAARRRAASADSKGMGSDDIERNGMGGGYCDTSSRGKSNSSTPTYRRSMQSSTSLKNMHTPVSHHPYSSASGMKGGDSLTEYGSSRTLARGDTQRMRSNSHDNGSDDSRIQMYSSNSRRGDGYEEGGPVMLATTPGRSRTNSSSRTPGRSATTGRSITPRQRSNSGSSRGRQMYNASNPPYEDGKDWGDSNRRRSSYSPRPRNRSSEGRDFDWRSWGGGGSRSRHRSGGGERPPRFDDGPAEYFGDRASMDAEMPPRRSRRDHSPWGRQYRSHSQEHSQGRSGGHGHSHGGGSHRGHILGYRRSSSAPRVSPNRSSSESTDWTSEESRRRNELGDDPRNGRRDDRGRSMPAEEMGRRRGRRAHSTSSRSRSRPEMDRLDVENGDRYGHRRGGDFESRTAPNEREWGRRRTFESPSRHSPYRSGMADGDAPQDVSWEELRSRYLRDNNQEKPRVTKTHSLPEYGDAIRESDSLSTEGSIPFPPPNHERGYSADGKPPTGGAGEQWRDGAIRDRAFKGSGKLNNGKPAPPLSPSTRADSARAAARDAQMSAERALAAAATASQAADLAARAAMEAEAEAEAERYSSGGPLSMDNADEVTASTLTPNTSIRGRLAAFSPASARMAGSADKNKEQHTEQTPEAVAEMGRSRSRGRPDNSWVTARVRGPDTAGGSGGASGSGSVGVVGGQVGKTGVGGGGVDGSGRDSSVDSVGDIGGVGGRRKHHERLGEDLAAKRRAFVRQYSGSTCDDSEISLFDNMTPGIGGRKPYLSMNSEITSFDESEFSFGEGMQAMEAYARRTSGAVSPLRRGGAGAAATASASKDRVGIEVRRKTSPAPGAASKSPKPTKKAAATTADKNISEAVSSLKPRVAAT